MDVERLRQLLQSVQQGTVAVDDALHSLRDLPFEDVGDARLDHHRELRTGLPEVVFAQGKTPDQVADVMVSLAQHGPLAMATRADPVAFEAVRQRLPAVRYFQRARIIATGQLPPQDPERYLVVASGGTSDLPVAEEAAVTAELLGHRVERAYDVGVAGIHRLLAHRTLFRDAALVIVVAGMEGALGSVVGGLVSCPVVAVPTSVGYGASFGGLAALLTMLNSCAPGMVVVNIDNGFGAAAFAHITLRQYSQDRR